MYLLVILMSIHYIAFGSEYIIDVDSEGISWEEAEQNCQITYSSHLASIHSLTDNENVASVCREGNSQLCWIGLKYSEDNGQFEWTDGTDLDYTNWIEYAPSTATDDDGIKVEQCTRISKASDTWKYATQWNDVKCSTTQKQYICNKPSKAELGQTLCVSGLSEAYQILNGDWEAIGSTVYSEAIGPYESCIWSYGKTVYNDCLYTLETCTGDSYFMGMVPETGPEIFQQNIINYGKFYSRWNDKIIFECKYSTDFVDDECHVFDTTRWGNSGYENITFTYGECS
eukprot:9643_1